jgi:hypothetical protein
VNSVLYIDESKFFSEPFILREAAQKKNKKKKTAVAAAIL